MKNTLSSLVLVGALATSVGYPAHGEPNVLLVEENRKDVTTKVNILLKQAKTKLHPGEHLIQSGDQCMITIFGKKDQLIALLACNGTGILKYTEPVVNGETYLTQIFDIPTTNEGLLDPDNGCIVLQVPGFEEIKGSQCENTQEEEENGIQPLKRNTNGDYI